MLIDRLRFQSPTLPITHLLLAVAAISLWHAKCSCEHSVNECYCRTLFLDFFSHIEKSEIFAAT